MADSAAAVPRTRVSISPPRSPPLCAVVDQREDGGEEEGEGGERYAPSRVFRACMWKF